MPAKDDLSARDAAVSAPLPPATGETGKDAPTDDADLLDTPDPDKIDHQDVESDVSLDDAHEDETSTALAAAIPLLLIAGLLAFAIVLLFSRSDADPELTVVDPSERSAVSPIEPEGDAPVEGLGIVETFTDGDASGLGETDNGRNWGEVFGQWDILDGKATLVRDPDGRALVVVESGVVNGTMSATMPNARAQAGLVFRMVDFNNYWMLVAVPNVGTWNLRKVVDGNMTEVANLGLANSSDGVSVTITYDAELITVGVNGEKRAEVTDDTHLGATAVGLTSAGPTSTEATWDNLVVTPRLTPGRGE